MLENRGPHMVDNDFTPYSALNIFVKDLVSQSYICKTSLYAFNPMFITICLSKFHDSI